MKKPKILTAFSLLLILASCQTSKVSNGQAANDSSHIIVATYNGGKVTLKDVGIELDKLIAKNDKLKGLTFDKLSADQREIIIKEVVLKEIAYKEAKKRNLDDDKDYQETLKIFESEILKQKLFIALAKDAAEEKNVKKQYEQLAEKLKGKKDLRIKYITVKTREEAQEIYQSLLKAPGLFAAQAKKNSLDKEIGKKGGDLGYIVEDALPVEVVQQARSVGKGQIAKPILSSGKWIIVKFEDERPAEITPFDKAKESLAQNLARKAVEDFVSQNFEKANISVSLK